MVLVNCRNLITPRQMETLQLNCAPRSPGYLAKADKDIREAAEILLQLSKSSENYSTTMIEDSWNKRRKHSPVTMTTNRNSPQKISSQLQLTKSSTQCVVPVYPSLLWCYKSPTSASSKHPKPPNSTCAGSY